MNAEWQQPSGESCGHCPDLSVLLQLFLNHPPTSVASSADSIPDASLEHHIESCAKCQAVLQNIAREDAVTTFSQRNTGTKFSFNAIVRVVTETVVAYHNL